MAEDLGRTGAAAQAASEYSADVLVIGGGPAGAWAAIGAAQTGARVILVDKGFCGSSGATAPSGTGVWYVDPDPEKRTAAMESREALGGFLADRGWMRRVLARTYDSMNLLSDWGYPFAVGQDGAQYRVSLQGPEYMRLMRRRVKQAGVTILDNFPALELLVDDNGTVRGAAGVKRQGWDSWLVRAGAVVLASGGCAFLSKALGCNVLTGDGHLMAAEVGADFSGMEFSNAYGLGPAFSSVTKAAFYSWAKFTYEDGSEIPGAHARKRSILARALQQGPVYAQLHVTDAMKPTLRNAQPNFFLPFDRLRIDPFTQRFPIALRLEGTVRGTGGLRIADTSCATAVPGLYAAGDAATRELICGGFTGGGSHNAAWAMSSGYWAGNSAGDFARQERGSERNLRRAGRAGLRDGDAPKIDAAVVTASVQNQVFPFDRNYFRTEAGMTDSLTRLDALWGAVQAGAPASRADALRTREAAAMVAVARWMYRGALARTETRGMHKHMDYPQEDAAQRHYLTVGGLDETWVTPRPVADQPQQQAELAA